jgi:hypothetical protein
MFAMTEKNTMEYSEKANGMLKYRLGWRRLHNEELHNLYYSPNIRIVKSKRMTWAGHVTHMGK